MPVHILLSTMPSQPLPHVPLAGSVPPQALPRPARDDYSILNIREPVGNPSPHLSWEFLVPRVLTCLTSAPGDASQQVCIDCMGGGGLAVS